MVTENDAAYRHVKSANKKEARNLEGRAKRGQSRPYVCLAPAAFMLVVSLFLIFSDENPVPGYIILAAAVVNLWTGYKELKKRKMQKGEAANG